MPAQQKTFLLYLYERIPATALIVLFFAFVSFGGAMLQAKTAAADGLSTGFGTGRDVVTGMVVSVDQEIVDSVVPSNPNNADYVVGIAVNRDSSAVVFDDDDSVFVAAEGTVKAFVSTLSGDISEGDLVVVSSINGITMKKKPDLEGQKIVGVAKADFNRDSAGAELVTLENAGEVSVGLIDLEVLVGESASDQAAGDELNVLVRIGRRIAGRPVSLSQVILSSVLIVVSFLVSGALLFGAMKGSFTSLGRNPLSAKKIYRGMLRASAVALGVMALGITAGYLVLIV